MSSLSYYDSRRTINELFDTHLAQSASVLMSLVDHEIYEELAMDNNKKKHIARANAEIKSHLANYKFNKLLAFQINVGNSFFYSAAAPKTPISEKKEGFSEKIINNKRWRVFTLKDSSELITIHVGEPYSFRTSIAHNIALDLLLPLVIGLPLIAFLIWCGVKHSLSPLNQIAKDIDRRKPDQLQPIIKKPQLMEIKPLINAINRLMQRLNGALENERRFTADAAHELRTPLAGLKTQTQVAQRTKNEDRRQRALLQISRGIDKLTHMVNQLLMLSRLDPDKTGIQTGPVSLRELISDNIENLSNKAENKSINLSFGYDEEGRISGNSELISVLIRNLIENALNYTPSGGNVFITLAGLSESVEINILDTGPGIAPELRDRVIGRFVRGTNNHVNGSGLGLSIVQRIAEFHNAKFELDNADDGGLNVNIIFPR